MVVINISNKQYKVKEAKTEEERKKGLQKIEQLPQDEGMLFYFNYPQEVSMWMKDVNIPLDIIFLNDDQEVIQVITGKPNDETLLTCPDTYYVLEVNANSGIKIGDEMEFEDEHPPVMKVLAPDGSDQMLLWGGERIFSRIHTKNLIKKAKKANQTKEDKDYKALGKYMFKCIHTQDNRPAEYVQAPS